MSDIEYDYVLFIDEAGDDGLTKVKPIDADGSTEWLVLSGVLVRAEDEAKCREWLDDIRTDIASFQGSTLHFRKLSPIKQLRASEILARLDARVFSVCSNKKNMRGYRNERAAQAGGKQWFYNWVTRILMERATAYCLENSMRRFGRAGVIKVLFSARGGHSYGQTKAYWVYLKSKGKPLLAKHEIKFETLRFNLVDYVPHYMHAGLQLADIAASAFYQAVETSSPRWSTCCAKALNPIMARASKQVVDVGLVLQPHKIDQIGLSSSQREIFEFYGYEFQR
ncbi:DUF3800 domain-containing protein [Paracoccus sp. N5]|uniref:DUF3800 domain-containing protein n=1 Tax=Paracoccus sp. N5 TaxID=1101189 RepID=UPI00037449E9|nr:DUF3800 domain-containing protein [Paracoccus sp. N5]